MTHTSHHTGFPHSKGFYRSRNGAFLGVCRGFAEWRDISVGWTRILVILLMFITGFWPVFFGYLILALVLKKEPIITPSTMEEKEFYDSYAHSRTQALHRLKNLFDELDRRTQRIENKVTSAEYDWQRRFDQS